ncbi:Alpha/Beta hydrolase protein [Xylariomycetidae sp. FL0641]|nr:Alpha/Beta hydrolase protein [Xylariomycetidae sp. FL0641]
MKFLSALSTFLGLAGLSAAASLQQVTDFGENSSGTLMYIYVPDTLADSPPVVVAIHYCSGTAEAYYTGSPYAGLADQYGFIVIYPQSPYEGTCWDVSSNEALTHDGGADSNSIANMVAYTLDTYGADSSRVFVTGSSSGAMMTNVLAATYPDVFAAGVVYSGVAAGCFYTGTVNGWNSSCSGGQLVETQAYWADTARAMYPGYAGAYPRMRIQHGSADTTLAPQNYNESIKQWTGVWGYPEDPVEAYPDDPASPFTRYVYGENVEGMYGIGITHDDPIFGDADMEWFGISGNTATTTAAASSTATAAPTVTSSQTTSAPSATTTSGAGLAQQWGQCGGSGWTGPTECESPYTCTYSNDYYSQCL